MKFLPLLALLAASVALAQDVTPTPLPATHPLLGTWRIDLPNGCFEEYTLRADGTKLSVSGAERNESVFQMSLEPLPSGFYQWTDKITRGNGQPDCGGAVTAVGHVAVNYVRLHPSFDRFVLCGAPNMRSCFAEFRRKSGGA